MFRWYFEFRAAMEARQLNRDAPLIIRHALDTFNDRVLNEIADLAREHIDRSHKQYGTSVIDLKRAHFDYKRLHKEARRRAAQAELSGLTLTIIYLRAEIAGEPAAPACQAINAFIADYGASEAP